MSFPGLGYLMSRVPWGGGLSRGYPTPKVEATAAVSTHPIGMPSCYRPQTKFVKVMFLHLFVSHSVHRGDMYGGGHVWQGCVHGRGHAWWAGGGACVAWLMWPLLLPRRPFQISAKSFWSSPFNQMLYLLMGPQFCPIWRGIGECRSVKLWKRLFSWM